MQTSRHVMVDIETYDTKPTAVILSIGAVTMTGPEIKFYEEIDINTQYERTASVSTKEWWAKQGNPPIHGSTSLGRALENFRKFLQIPIEDNIIPEPIIWCKGTDFDVAILTHAYNQLYLPVPWKYNNVRDCRTLFKVLSIGEWPTQNNHNALDDAVNQATRLSYALAGIGKVLA